jgi:ribonuclease III
LREPAERLGRGLGYRFKDLALAELALTHRSAGGSNNERLEFLGDAILGFVIADALYHQQGRASEGQLSRLRSGLVRRDSLAEIARGLDLGSYLILGQGELCSGGQSRDSILADSLEALFAAIYLDGGYQQVRQVILALFQERLGELSPEGQLKDPKTRLQEYLQGRRLELPNYEVIEVVGDAHDQTFRVVCRVPSLEAERKASGSSRRRAEQAAAAKVLEWLGVE